MLNNECGVKGRFHGVNRPYDWFRVFMTETILTRLVIRTNLYAAAKNHDGWKNLSKDELLVWFAITIHMGLEQLPRIEDYWASTMFRTSHMGSFMSARRFQDIRSCLHVGVGADEDMDDGADIGDDKIGKVRWILQEFRRRCQDVYIPSQNISYDEMMLKTKSQFCPIKQRMPLKPIRDGVKVFAACEAKTGYLINYVVYDGSVYDREQEVGKTGATMLHVFGHLNNLGHTIFMDNYFPTLLNIRALHQNKFNIVATCRKDRIPEDMKFPDKRFNAGHITHRTNVTDPACPIAAHCWQDRGVVCLLSTTFHASMRGVVERKSGATVEKIDAPLAAVEYNKFMGGVDLADALRTTYEVRRKSFRWWLCILFWIVDSCITNARVCATDNGDRVRTNLEFRKMLVKEIITLHHTRGLALVQPDQQPLAPAIQRFKAGYLPDSRLLPGRHYPIRYREHIRNGACKWCAYQGVTKKSVYHCMACHVPLCVLCFKDYHTVPLVEAEKMNAKV